MKIKLIFLIFVLIIFSLAFNPAILAQEESADINEGQEAEEVIQDEEITAEDLEVSDPKILPDSPFYFLKNIWRTIRSTFTFGAVNKAELRLKYANQRLIEAKKLAEKTNKEKLVEKTVEKYQEEMKKVKTQAERFKEKAKEDLKIDKFLNKFTDKTIKQQRLLDCLEKNLSDKPEVLERIRNSRERALEHFGEVMERLEEKNQISTRLEESLEKIEGSKFKNFKNLEILINLENKIPEEAKEAIQQAQENSLKRLHEDLEQMSPQDQEKFNEYLENIGGDQAVHMEILQQLNKQKSSQALNQEIQQARERAEERIKNMQENRNNAEIQERAREQEKEKIEQQTKEGENKSNAK